MMRRFAYTFILILSLLSQGARAQAQTLEQYNEQARALVNQPLVQTAFDSIERNRERILREWIAITEINAPSEHEKPRAAYIAKLLRKYRLSDIHYDGIGNLIAVRKGTGGAPPIVFDAHLDTVFQPGLKIKAEIRDGRIYAPGIGDDTRNIEALLASIRALNAAKIRTKGDLIFLFTVREETELAGAEFFIKENKGKFAHYVALDGGYEGFTYAGIGINWYRHHFIGPGGHTLSDAPPYSASLPLARAIQRIYELPVPDDPFSKINVGMLGGSAVVNAKAADAWFTLDLRSTSNEVIADLDKKIAAILTEEADRAGMTLKTDIISQSPAAQIPGHRNSYLVQMAEAVHRAMGFDPPISAIGSNNSSAALLAGVSAISTGAGPCTNTHSLTESCEIEPFYKGIKKIILLELALAQLP